MKNFKLLACFCTCAFVATYFCGCQNDDDLENSETNNNITNSKPETTGKLLMELKGSNGYFVFNYDDNRLLKTASVGPDSLEFEWLDSEICIRSYNRNTKKFFNSTKIILNNGIIVSNPWGSDTTYLYYDNNAHLTELQINDGYKNLWLWENDNITTFMRRQTNYETSKHDTTIYTCTYHPDLINRHPTIETWLLGFNSFSNISSSRLLLLAHPNLIGTYNKNLLKSFRNYTYTYELDSEGYPIVITETFHHPTSDYSMTTKNTLIWQ